MTTRILSTLSISLALSGCALDEQIDDFEETEQSIKDGDPAATWMWQRAVLVTSPAGICTGTLISPTHVLTAAHCKPDGGQVLFFTSSNNVNGTSAIAVSAEYPSGVNPFVDDLHDDNDKFADVAVLTLASSAPRSSVVADLSWTYGGADAWGIKVGAGSHDGNASLIGQLRYATDITYSASDSDGLFHTEECDTNPGDSGGPFYNNPPVKRVVGVLWGQWLDGVVRNRYTSVRMHLSWILGRIGYTFGGLEFSGFRRLGSPLQPAFPGAKNVCEYACERTTGCVAFNWLQYFNSCQLLSATTGITAQAGYVTGEK